METFGLMIREGSQTASEAHTRVGATEFLKERQGFAHLLELPMESHPSTSAAPRCPSPTTECLLPHILPV